MRNLEGVRLVINKIELRPQRKLSAADVRLSIEEALERRAEHHSERIRLDVSDGNVTLSGIVSSWAEREAILDAARGTPGVKDVHSNLRIEPYAQ